MKNYLFLALTAFISLPANAQLPSTEVFGGSAKLEIPLETYMEYRRACLKDSSFVRRHWDFFERIHRKGEPHDPCIIVRMYKCNGDSVKREMRGNVPCDARAEWDEYRCAHHIYKRKEPHEESIDDFLQWLTDGKKFTN